MKFDNSTRDKFLSATVYPAARLYMRRMRLDFGNSWEQENDGGALGSTASDDFYDDGEERVVWGDSCVLVGGAKVRMISDAA